METKKTKRAEPILVEQITTPVTMGCTILAIALGVMIVMFLAPKLFCVAIFGFLVWLVVCIVKNNKQHKNQ